MPARPDPEPRPRRGGHQGGGRGDATRDRIIDAAEACIAEFGLNGTNSTEVVRRAGVTFGAIQYHFGTYEAVLLAVVERAAGRLRAMLEAVQMSGRSVREQVTDIVDVMWSYYGDPQYQVYIELSMSLRRDPATSRRTVEIIKDIDDRSERLWHDLAVTLLGTDDDEAAIQRLLFATLRGMGVSRWLSEGRFDFDRERQIFADLLAGYVAQVRARQHPT
ncbi:MAG TPA: TetR/AcrR family transcriptional regulator [Acidimicrobiales bacterium]|nr:TetR/AcrR family transcriptional regulator [Acidimicrobiales bacterium]